MKKNIIIALFSAFAILCSCNNSTEIPGTLNDKWGITLSSGNKDTFQISANKNNCDLEGTNFSGTWSGNTFTGKSFANSDESILVLSMNGLDEIKGTIHISSEDEYGEKYYDLSFTGERIIFRFSDIDPYGLAFVLTILSLIIFNIAGRWKIYEKAGREGWTAIVPIYAQVVYLEILNKPVWWLFFMLFPFVNIVFEIILIIRLSESFKKSAPYTFGMIFLFPIFVPLLGFDKSEYSRVGE